MVNSRYATSSMKDSHVLFSHFSEPQVQLRLGLFFATALALASGSFLVQARAHPYSHTHPDNIHNQLPSLHIDSSYSRANNSSSYNWIWDRITSKSHPFPTPVSTLISAAEPPNNKNQDIIPIYVLDSGINTKLKEFAHLHDIRSVDFINATKRGQLHLCMNHGTQVASLAVGRTYGIATTHPTTTTNTTTSAIKAPIDLISIRTITCSLSVSCVTLHKAMQWLITDKRQRYGSSSRAVALMAMAVLSTRPHCAEIEELTRALYDANVVVVAAAGNSRGDGCHVYPGASQASISVGATDRSDDLWTKSSRGKCVDIYAPGHQVPVIDATGNKTETSGTSFSTPIVAGAVLRLMMMHPQIQAKQAVEIVLDSATRNAIAYGDRAATTESGDHMNRREIIPKAKLLYVPYETIDQRIANLHRQCSSNDRFLGGSITFSVLLQSLLFPHMAYTATQFQNHIAAKLHMNHSCFEVIAVNLGEKKQTNSVTAQFRAYVEPQYMVELVNTLKADKTYKVSKIVSTRVYKVPKPSSALFPLSSRAMIILAVCWVVMVIIFTFIFVLRRKPSYSTIIK